MSSPTKPILFLLLLCTTVLSSLANERFTQIYREKIEALSDVSSALINALEPSARCRAAENCNDGDCLPNGCSHDAFGEDYKCSSLLRTVGQSDFCSKSCVPDSRLLNLATSILTTPPNTLRYESKRGVQNIQVQDLQLRRDVCAMKGIQNSLREAFDKHELRSWLYVSSSSGLMMTYPGSAHSRTEPDLRSCGFVPMRRPWYIAAASGSKDVVFLFDRTSLTTTEKVLPKALISELERLQRDDHVAVVAMSDKVEVLASSGSPTTLTRADEGFKAQLIQAVRRLQPSSGQPVIKEAIEKAFDILQDSEEQQRSSLCSKIIVLLTGNAPACFRECNARPGECQCTTDIVNAVRAKQGEMRNRRVSIVAFTEGRDNDAQRVARSVVCEAFGASVWHQVQPNDPPESAMSAYTDIASLTQTSKEYTSNIYVDGFGLGEMITISRPMYERGTSALVGVSGVDITITEIASILGSRKAAIDAIEDQIRRERRVCKQRTPDSCAQQQLRGRHGGICADVLVREDKPWKCYKAGSSLFLRSETLQSWEEARSSCQRLGSGVDLAVLDNSGKNELVASISDYDGSWIGLREQQGGELKWITGSSFDHKAFSFNFDYEAEIRRLHEGEFVDACVAVDRRGTSGNWNVVPCDAKRMAICEVKTSANVSSVCPQDVIFDMRNTEYEPVHRVDCDSSETITCPVDQDTALKKANPMCPEGKSPGRSEFDRRCCGGRSDRGPTQCEKTESKSSSGAAIGGAVGAVVVVAAVVVLAILFFRRRSNAKEVSDGPHLETTGSDVPPPAEGSEDDLHLPFPKRGTAEPPPRNTDDSKPPIDQYDSLDV